MLREFQLITEKRNQMINIDEKLLQGIREEEIDNGIATIFCPHTTAAVTINENGDPDVQRIYSIYFKKYRLPMRIMSILKAIQMPMEKPH